MLSVTNTEVILINMNKIKDESFGVVPVISMDGRVIFCLVYSKKNAHWGFPKGHKDAEESDQEAALRELEEETGIVGVDLIDSMHLTEEFSFEKKGSLCEKTVKYFIGIVKSTEHSTPQDFKEEISEIRWVDYDEAQKLITFPERKIVLEKANNYIVNDLKI